MRTYLLILCLALTEVFSVNITSRKVLSESPRIYLIENFLSYKECDYVVSAARKLLARSTVADLQSGQSVVHDARTSQGMFFPQFPNDPVLKKIEKRISVLTQFPVENGEAIQVLRYGVGGEYKPHYDFFDSKTPGGAIHFNRGGQRIATLIMYLHTTEEGGETIFPYANVQVKPVKGNAILFYNCLPDGSEDSRSLHGGAPVIKGEKWIATKWLRSGVFR